MGGLEAVSSGSGQLMADFVDAMMNSSNKLTNQMQQFHKFIT